MRICCNELHQSIAEFNSRLKRVTPGDKANIANICFKLEDYLSTHGLVCRRYDLYKAEWERFERNLSRNPKEKSIYELFVYMFIYSREEHMSGGYGGSYVRAYENGTIPCILNELVYRLEEMADNEKDSADKTGFIGVSGELYVAAELTRRGIVASITSKNTKSIDILASDKKGKRFAAIQVKTSSNHVHWKMSKSVEANTSNTFYYVLVDLNNGEAPLFYIVPSEYLVYRVKQDYDEWYGSPGKNGQKHNETNMRTFSFVDKNEAEQYRDAWHLLGL